MIDRCGEKKAPPTLSKIFSFFPRYGRRHAWASTDHDENTSVWSREAGSKQLGGSSSLCAVGSRKAFLVPMHGDYVPLGVAAAILNDVCNFEPTWVSILERLQILREKNVGHGLVQCYKGHCRSIVLEDVPHRLNDGGDACAPGDEAVLGVLSRLKLILLVKAFH